MSLSIRTALAKQRIACKFGLQADTVLNQAIAVRTRYDGSLVFGGYPPDQRGAIKSEVVVVWR